MAPESTLSDTSDLRNVIINRLAEQTSLRIPGQLSRNDEPITLEKRSVYLRNLLTHDPGVFLERHGDQLVGEELINYFGPLRATSYEVDFYMKLLEDKIVPVAETAPDPTSASPTSSSARKKSTAKNRRLAKLGLLEKEGYFKLEAMRSREPYLYHLYIGQYSLQVSSPLEEENGGLEEVSTEGTENEEVLLKQASATKEASSIVSSAAAQLVENILDKHDELDLMVRREAERESYALQEEESESEEEEDEKEKDGGKGMAKGGGRTTRNDAEIPGEWPTPEELTNEQR